MNLNIVKQEEGSIGTILVNEQEMNVARFKLYFVDMGEETDIACVMIWYFHGGNRTIFHVVNVESF